LVQELRQAEFRGGAGVKAAVEWAATLIELDREEMDPKETSAGIAQILKRHQDGEVNAVADALARGAE
ncbi:MAG: hypothetical protein HN333_07180, partial [Rhodospirillaceae bacterium]|nr:hypothetical protein [Rhodospirillaceae bacterium]